MRGLLLHPSSVFTIAFRHLVFRLIRVWAEDRGRRAVITDSIFHTSPPFRALVSGRYSSAIGRDKCKSFASSSTAISGSVTVTGVTADGAYAIASQRTV
jgi:hypothetical protein